MIDANQRWEVPEAIEWVTALKEYKPLVSYILCLRKNELNIYTFSFAKNYKIVVD